MYPDLRYVFEALFGYAMPPWLGIFKTFGFFVAIAFIIASYTITSEVKRKEWEGKLGSTVKKKIIGKPPSVIELLLAMAIGFILGYLLSGLLWEITGADISQKTPNAFNERIIVGVIAALLIGYLRYKYIKKQQLPVPEVKPIIVHPQQRIGEIVTIAAISGLVGAKVFNALETWEDFIQDPINNLFSGGGLTFYGGLIFAFVAVYYYSRRHKIAFNHLCDAAAPGLMLAYGTGRLGCHFSGDGDWGIFNSAYLTAPDGSLYLASKQDYQNALENAAGYFTTEFGNLHNVPHVFLPAPTWLPDWLVAMNYPHNVINNGIDVVGCTGRYCSVLPVGVFPTSLYESVICILLFALLWLLRKRFRHPLQLFGLYLLLNGVERFFIEKIRVNYVYDWGFIHPTQAEIISTGLILAGTLLFLLHKIDPTNSNKLIN